MKALEMGAVEDLILWEGLDIVRSVMRNTTTSEEAIVHWETEEWSEDRQLCNPETSGELEIVETKSLVSWLVDNHKRFGCNLEIVADCSLEGTQFVKGFGGIGGILRWKVDFQLFNRSGGEDCNSWSGSEEDSNTIGGDYDFDEGDFGF